MKRGVMMKPLEKYCKRALEKGLKGARGIDPSSVVTAEWVRIKCLYHGKAERISY